MISCNKYSLNILIERTSFSWACVFHLISKLFFPQDEVLCPKWKTMANIWQSTTRSLTISTMSQPFPLALVEQMSTIKKRTSLIVLTIAPRACWSLQCLVGVETWITKYFLWVVTIFQNPNPANAHMLRVQSAPNTNDFKFSLAAVEQLGACGASLLHNLSSSVNLKRWSCFKGLPRLFIQVKKETHLSCSQGKVEHQMQHLKR